MTDKETKTFKYEDLTIDQRYQRIEALWNSIESTIKGEKTLTEVEGFFIVLHNLGAEIKRFISHYFNDKDPAVVIGNLDILNKVNKIQLMISIR